MVVQLGKRNDVVSDGLQTLCFLVDLAGEHLDVFGLRHAVLDKFRIARDGGERRFQFVRGVGREFIF